jgi:hypothetical protein
MLCHCPLFDKRLVCHYEAYVGCVTGHRPAPGPGPGYLRFVLDGELLPKIHEADRKSLNFTSSPFAFATSRLLLKSNQWKLS